MNLALIIYLSGLADNLHIAGWIILVGALVTALVSAFSASDCSYNLEREKFHMSRLKKSIWGGIITLIIMVIIPSSKTIYLMLGISVAEDAVDGVQKSEVYQGAMDILKLKLNDIKEDLIKEQKRRSSND